MEAATTVPAHPLGVQDATGTPLSTGDRVKVTGSASFGEGLGTVIGCIVAAQDTTLDPATGELRTQTHDEKPVRIRVRMDNGHGEDGYHASAGRVNVVDEENTVPADEAVEEVPASA